MRTDQNREKGPNTECVCNKRKTKSPVAAAFRKKIVRKMDSVKVDEEVSVRFYTVNALTNSDRNAIQVSMKIENKYLIP